MRGGIDADTIASVLDYTIRVSSREAYVSPTSGAQGNALKTILAMGYVLDRGDHDDAAGVTIIEAHGVAHRIEFRVDHVNNQPRIIHTSAPSDGRGRNPVHHSLAARQPHILFERLRDTSSSAVSSKPMLVQSASHLARDMVRPGIHQREGDQSRLGQVAAAQPDHPPTGMTRPGCSAISPPMWRGTATSGRSRTVRAFIAEFRGSRRHRRPAQDPRPRSAARINRWRFLRRRAGEQRGRRQAARGDEGALEAGRSEAPRHYRRRTFQGALSRRGRQCPRPSNTSCARA